jgi:hypothetical protein
MGARVATLAAATLLGAGCFVGLEVEEVSDPGPAFARARAEAARLEGRTGPAERLRVLVYDRDDGTLVRASVPMWVVERMDDEGIDVDLDDEAAERIRSHIKLSDIQKAPLGPLVEVEEEDGDQVLVWLE